MSRSPQCQLRRQRRLIPVAHLGRSGQHDAPAMQKCSYCGRDNNDAATFCSECGTSLTEPPTPIPLTTPHRMMGEIQQSIWAHFAVKRRQFYLAGFFIGAFGAFIAAMHHAENGFSVWSVPVGGAFGVGAVSLLSFVERLQARIDKARAQGSATGRQQALFVVLALIALLVVVLLVGAICAWFF
jgi:hypothetical protein